MPVYICGYIEVARDYGFDDQHWMPMVDIGCMGLMTGDICQILFGESKNGPDSRWAPIAHRRGLPIDVVTPQAAEALQIANNSSSGLWGFTYINFEELKQLDWARYEGADLTELEFGWNQLLAIMDAIEGYFGYQRLIVWFEW